MNFDWRKLDLRKANIFDLTDDIELIRLSTANPCIELDDRDEYVRKNNIGALASDMRAFAFNIKDDELHTELGKIFSKEITERAAMIEDDLL